MVTWSVFFFLSELRAVWIVTVFYIFFVTNEIKAEEFCGILDVNVLAILILERL